MAEIAVLCELEQAILILTKFMLDDPEGACSEIAMKPMETMMRFHITSGDIGKPIGRRERS